MADPISAAEFEFGIQQLAITVQESGTALESDPPPSKSIIRRLMLKLQKQIELVERFKSPKGKTDTLEYATKAVQVVYEAKTNLAELPALIVEEEMPLRTPQKSMNNMVLPPRNLEIQVPVFDGAFENYATFIEAFQIAVDHPAVSTKQKFLFFRDKLGQRPKNLIAHIPVEEENYERVLKIIEDKYNNRAQIVR